jgi:hypothetical protein
MSIKEKLKILQNSRLKELMGYILIFLMGIILIISNPPTTFFSGSNVFLLIYVFLFIIIIFFKKKANEIMSMLGLSIVLSFLIALIFLWLFKIPLPFTADIMTDQSIMAIFTIVLAFATIVNVVYYRKSIDLSRTTNLVIEIDNSLNVQIKNKGQFTARNINVELKLLNQSIPPIKQNFFKRFKDIFIPEEKSISFLTPDGEYPIDFGHYIKKRFDLINNPDDRVGGYLSRKKRDKKDFKMIVSVKYFTDTLSHVPFPVIKKVRVKIDKLNGMRVIREYEQEYFEEGKR